MTREQFLEILMLLSALESWSFSVGKPLPDYLQDRMTEAVEILRKEALK